jgi:hypothetical protein
MKSEYLKLDKSYSQKKKRKQALTYMFLAFTLALNLMSAFTSSTLLSRDARMSGVLPIKSFFNINIFINAFLLQRMETSHMRKINPVRKQTKKKKKKKKW